MIEKNMSIQCIFLVLIDAHFCDWNYGIGFESYPKQLLPLKTKYCSVSWNFVCIFSLLDPAFGIYEDMPPFKVN